MADQKDVNIARSLTTETQALLKVRQKEVGVLQQIHNLEQELVDQAIMRDDIAGDIIDRTDSLSDKLKQTKTTEDALAAVRKEQVDYIQSMLEAGEELDEVYLRQLKSMEAQFDAVQKKTAAEEARKTAMDEITSGLDAQMGKVGEIINAIKTGGMIAGIAVAFAFVAKKLFEVADATKQLTRDLGVSIGKGAELSTSIASAGVAATRFGGSVEDGKQVVSALSKEAGGLANVTEEAAFEATRLSLGFGLGAENAVKVQKAMMDVTDGTAAAARDMTDFVANLAEANNVAPTAVLEDIANNTEVFAKFGKEGAENFIKTSIAAKKLGVEMSSIASAAESLLNIEDSISKQMEAEVLLGRQINLDKATQAAFQGDYLTLTKELANQVGSVAEFNQMNTIQQQALADALGMSVADTRKMVENQDKLAGLSEEALNHYKETGEIQEQGSSILNEQNAAMAAAGVKTAAAIGALMTQLGIRTKIFGVTKATAEAESGGGGGQTGGLMDKIGKIKMSDVIKGAAAMLIVAAAVFVFAKAVQEFMNVSWEAVGMAVVSMLALVGAVALLGMIMGSPMGAIAIILGAAAMLIVASAMLVLGVALGVIAEAIPNFMLFIPMLPQMAFGFLTLAPLLPILPFLGLGLIAFGAGMGMSAIGVGLFGAVGGPETISALAVSMATLVPLTNGIAMLGPAFMSMAAGIATLAGSLVLLTPMLPTLLLLGGLAGGIASIVGGGGESEGGGDDTSERLIAKLDELIGIVKQGGDVKLDGKKVGDVLTLAASPLGV